MTTSLKKLVVPNVPTPATEVVKSLVVGQLSSSIAPIVPENVCPNVKKVPKNKKVRNNNDCFLTLNFENKVL